MAVGDTLGAFAANHHVFTGVGSARFGSRGTHRTLLFNPTVTEQALFSAVMPRHYAEGGITVTLIWASADQIIANGVRWGVSLERLDAGGQDIDVEGFATEKLITANPASQAGRLVYSEIVFLSTEADLIAPGDAYRLRLRRLGTDGADTSTTDAEMLRLAIRES